MATLVRSIHQRLSPVPRLPFLRRGLNIGNVFLVQAHRVRNATDMDAHESVVAHSRDLAFENDGIADFYFSHTGIFGARRSAGKMSMISQKNKLIDMTGLNRFRIGDEVIAEACADHGRFEGVVIGIELQRVHGSRVLQPSITILHDGDCITDGFSPDDLRKVCGTEAPGIAELAAEYLAAIDADPVKDIWDTWDGKPKEGAEMTSSDAAWEEHGQNAARCLKRLCDALTEGRS